MRVLFFVAALLPAASALAEDLRASDGAIYHQAKVVQVDPDGLVIEHDKGIAKIDFQNLPPATRQRYGYNPRKAAAFQAQERQTVQQNQQIVKEYEERELARIRKAMESGAAGDELIYHGGPSQGGVARLARQMDSEVEARDEAVVAAAREPRTFWNASFWQTPVVKYLGMLFGGNGSSGEGPINIGAGIDKHRGFSN